MLYKSYQARGYLTSLGKKAKKGALPAEHLPLVVGRKRGSKAGGGMSG